MIGFKNWDPWDFSATSWNRVLVLTNLGTLCAIVLVLAVDSTPLLDGHWRMGG